MYMVWFDFVNDDGYVVTAFLDNNGKGFSFKDAEDLAHELKVRGHKNIEVTMCDSGDIDVIRQIAENQTEEKDGLHKQTGRK